MSAYNEMNADGPKDLSLIPQMNVLQFSGQFESKATTIGGKIFEAPLSSYDGRLVIWRSFIFVDKLEGYCK